MQRFAQSNVDFAFPSPDLSSIEITTNMANIDRLTRMQKAKWPEFSWEIVRGQENTRVFQTFEENISRLGYDNEGRIWSIICPQQGFRSYIGNLNVEVSVTGKSYINNIPKSIAMSKYSSIFFCLDFR